MLLALTPVTTNASVEDETASDLNVPELAVIESWLNIYEDAMTPEDKRNKTAFLLESSMDKANFLISDEKLQKTLRNVGELCRWVDCVNEMSTYAKKNKDKHFNFINRGPDLIDYVMCSNFRAACLQQVNKERTLFKGDSLECLEDCKDRLRLAVAMVD